MTAFAEPATNLEPVTGNTGVQNMIAMEPTSHQSETPSNADKSSKIEPENPPVNAGPTSENIRTFSNTEEAKSTDDGHYKIDQNRECYVSLVTMTKADLLKYTGKSIKSTTEDTQDDDNIPGMKLRKLHTASENETSVLYIQAKKLC